MQLRQLEIFLAVARHCSFSKAADALYLTQSTVSSHIRALETELNVTLFVRSTASIKLTAQGQVLYTYAAQIVNFTNRIKDELCQADNNGQSKLSIAASTVPAQYLLPFVLPDVKRCYPKLCFYIKQSNSISSIQAVSNGASEIGIVGDKVTMTNLIYYPLIEEKLVIATPNTSYFRSMKGRMSTDVLQNLSFIIREQGSGTRKNMERFMAMHNISLEHMKIVAEMSSTECVLRSVCNGLGVSLVSSLAAGLFADSGNLLLLNSAHYPLIRRQFYCVIRKDVPLSTAAHCLMDKLRKFKQNQEEH